MKKIVIALSAIALLAACQKSLIDSEGLYENGIVAFQANDSGEMAAFLETSGPVTFTIASSVKVDKDVTVSATGNAEINQDLSEQRASVVVNMLKKAGIAASRISYKAAGSDRDASQSPESNRVAVCIVK